MEILAVSDSDRKEISVVHKNSIKQLCKNKYSSKTIKLWTHVLSPQIYKSAIKEKYFVKAVYENKIAGFGIMDFRTNSIDALYTCPYCNAKNKGSFILEHFEQTALQKKIDALYLFSTLNAVGFYIKKGFSEIGKDEHTLSNKLILKSIKMKKILNSK